MAEKKELNEENLADVSGGEWLPDGSYLINSRDDIDVKAEQMKKQYAGKPVKKGVKNSGPSDDSGVTVNNSISGTGNKSGVQGQNISLGDNSQFNL